MGLPFTHDQFLDLFADYNRALWPALLALWLITAFALVRLYLGSPSASRLMTAVLALHWTWSGAVYHLAYFRRINPAALVFGILFLAEAALLFRRVLSPTSLVFEPMKRGWSLAAAVLVLYSLAYPALGLWFGLRVPRLPSYGVPCPTGLLTMGLLLLVPRRDARILGIVPLLWAVIGGSAAWLLGVRADLALPVGGIVLLAYMLSGRARPTS